MAPEGIARNSTYRAEELPDQLRSRRAHVICTEVSPQTVDRQKGLTRDAGNTTQIIEMTSFVCQSVRGVPAIFTASFRFDGSKHVPGYVLHARMHRQNESVHAH